MFCGNCGKKATGSARFCGVCGQAQLPTSASKSTAGPVLEEPKPLAEVLSLAGAVQSAALADRTVPVTQPGEKPLFCRHSPSERTTLGVDTKDGAEICRGCGLSYAPGSSGSGIRPGVSSTNTRLAGQSSGRTISDPGVLESTRTKNATENPPVHSSIKTWRPTSDQIAKMVVVIVIVTWLSFKVGLPIVNFVLHQGTTTAQSTAEREANQAGQSDGSQLKQNMDDGVAKDFCVSMSDSNRLAEQMNNGLTDTQGESLVQPYIDGCMQGYKDSRR